MAGITIIAKENSVCGIVFNKTSELGTTEEFGNTLLELSAALKIEEETCDTLNQLMQSLSEAWELARKSIEELVVFFARMISEEYLRILPTQEDTARQEQGRKAGRSKYLVKWREKYRPP